MKFILILVLWISAIAILPAQGPRMTVAGTGAPMRIEEAAVRVELSGGAARTEFELVFRNDTARMVEGEFTLPLPPGATVSSYALEVNGALREAVAVEKERARHAYESIKRQMVDPGIVEREAGNVYRTRVFPIPANGTKRLRIGYVETLAEDAGKFRYRLPLRFQGPLGKFRCVINGAGGIAPTLEGALPISFRADMAADRTSSEAAAVTLDGVLALRLPLPDGPEVRVGGGDEPVFVLTDVFPEGLVAKRPPVKSLLLFWDASESAASGDLSATFRVLDAWFKKQGDVTVDLKFLRDRVEDAGSHEVRGGDWKELRAILETAECGGGTSFEGLKSAGRAADVVIYSGDGVATMGGTVGTPDRPLLVLKRGQNPAVALRAAAIRSGGALVVVDRLGVDDALAKLEDAPYRVVEVTGDGVSDVRVDEEISPGRVVRASGRLGKKSGKILISYGIGAEVKVRREVNFAADAEGGEVVRRLWAQRELAALEAEAVPDVDKIIAHCRRHARERRDVADRAGALRGPCAL